MKRLYRPIVGPYEPVWGFVWVFFKDNDRNFESLDIKRILIERSDI